MSYIKSAAGHAATTAFGRQHRAATAWKQMEPAVLRRKQKWRMGHICAVAEAVANAQKAEAAELDRTGKQPKRNAAVLALRGVKQAVVEEAVKGHFAIAAQAKRDAQVSLAYAVLYNNDLLDAVLSNLDLDEHTAKGVCKLWRAAWARWAAKKVAFLSFDRLTALSLGPEVYEKRFGTKPVVPNEEQKKRASPGSEIRSRYSVQEGLRKAAAYHVSRTGN